MKTYADLPLYLATSFLEWEISEMKVLQQIKTQILCPVTFFSKIVPFMR
jgi:hypothetical protein